MKRSEINAALKELEAMCRRWGKCQRNWMVDIITVNRYNYYNGR